MSDLISRQDAVNIINGYAEQFNGYIGTPNDSEVYAYARGLLLSIERNISALPSAQPEQRWIPVTERLPDDNREVEVTCEIRRVDGKKYRYTCHASYVHRYSIESTDYCNWEDCDEYNEEEDKYYALSGWYERVHNWEDYSYCAIEDFVIAWRELSEPYGGEQE